MKLDHDENLVHLDEQEREALERIHDTVETPYDNATVHTLPLDEVYVLEEDAAFLLTQIKRINRGSR